MEFCCSVCKYTSFIKRDVARHVERKNSCGPGKKEIVEIPVEIKCEYCNKNFYTKSNLSDHIKNNCKHRTVSTEPQQEENVKVDLCTSDSVYFYKELFSKFLLRKPEIPLCQRSYVDERINHFYEQLLLKKNNGDLPYIGIIHCALYKQENVSKTFIVDGQHRFYAYKKYYENTKHDFTIQIMLKHCLSKDEVTLFFKALNDNYNLHEIILDDFDRAEIIKTHIQTNYGKHISNSEKPNYPNINLDQIIKYVIDRFSSSNIIDEFEKLNKDIHESIKDNEKYNKTKQGLYIGYLFVKGESDTKKKKIPVTVRHRLWINHFEDTIVGECTVCGTKIDNANFHAGHIVSSRNGGSDNITNLSPVCSCCNLSMGTQDLNDFRNKYF